MPQKFSNKARSQLLAAISATDTSFSVVAADADLFPTANVGTGTLPSAPGDWFKAVIEDSNGYEIVYVRTRSAGSNVFSNVLRGQEGTTARSFPAGAVVGVRVTAQDAETAAKVPDLQAQITGLASSKLDVAAPSFGGNAATATRLQTARTLTIGNTGKAFDGSANVSWSLGEILGNGVPATAQELGGGVDLNTIQTPGFYVQRLDVHAASGTNYPVPIAGALMVLRNSWGVTQVYFTYGHDSRIFLRAYYNDGSVNQWFAWREVYHSGNLGAATESSAGIVRLATFAEAQALVSAVAALTPARLADAFKGANQSLSANGYQRLPGGLIIQWGSVSYVVDNDTVEVTFPIAFPNACVIRQATIIAPFPGGVVSTDVGVLPTATPRSTMSVWYNSSVGGSASIGWLAIGY